MHRGEGEKQDKDKTEETTQCNVQWQPRRAPKGKGTEKKQGRGKRDEQTTTKCAMRSVETGPDPEGH